jgi:hypothetical protein
LISINAHTGRRVVPMCFQGQVFEWLITGEPRSPRTPNPLFLWAPQRALYPTADARPAPEAIHRFMRSHGIEYVYTDPFHSDTLVADAVPIASADGVRLLRVREVSAPDP